MRIWRYQSLAEGDRRNKDMCDPECRKRFEAVEKEVHQIANDMKWIRWLIRTVIVIGGAAFGVDVSGLV